MGYFPLRCYVRKTRFLKNGSKISTGTVIGQPTGTSIRFANHAAAAIRRWGDQHGCVDCEIEKVALEGEGKIAERVDNLVSSNLPYTKCLKGRIEPSPTRVVLESAYFTQRTLGTSKSTNTNRILGSGNYS